MLLQDPDKFWQLFEAEQYASCHEWLLARHGRTPVEDMWVFLHGEVLRRLGRLTEANAILGKLHPRGQDASMRHHVEVSLGQIAESRGVYDEAEFWLRLYTAGGK